MIKNTEKEDAVIMMVQLIKDILRKINIMEKGNIVMLLDKFMKDIIIMV